MSAILLVVVIVVLVVVHELGHLVAAKLSGMRVDEFGLGYPPRAKSLGRVGETEVTLNWIPFGGFVKIFGEDDPARVSPRAFASKNRALQAFVLVAGVAMNLVLAYVLIVAALVIGTPRALGPEELAVARDQQLMVANILPNSPAEAAGIEPGDVIEYAVTSHGAWNPTTAPETALPTPGSFSAFVTSGGSNVLKLSVRRAGGAHAVTAEPVQGLVESDPGRYAIGVEVATIGVVPTTLSTALADGFTITRESLVSTARGLAAFFSNMLLGRANLAEVSGPVGIAGAVGAATAQGLGSLLSLVALISINLAIINLIPVPALDGGRLLFVIIETVIRRPIAPRVAQTVNSIGFALLLLLMVVITAHDIFKIVG